MPEGREFSERYGPWALVLGASNGVGAEYARAMAERGINVAIVARTKEALEGVGRSIELDFGVETRALVTDLGAEDAASKVIDATAGLEVGMLMYNAGSDPYYRPFLTSAIDPWLWMMHRNCIVPMQLCHHFAARMVERGTGGIVIVGSAAGLHGAPNMVTYGATKAFDIVFTESLWAELGPKGVDVLSLILGATDTPFLRNLMAERGILTGPDDPSPIAGATSAKDTVVEALANLGKGSTWLVGERVRQRSGEFAQMSRSDVVRALVDNAGGIMENDRDDW
jgi:short-subunit dehydrogenase